MEDLTDKVNKFLELAFEESLIMEQGSKFRLQKTVWQVEWGLR